MIMLLFTTSLKTFNDVANKNMILIINKYILFIHIYCIYSIALHR